MRHVLVSAFDADPTRPVADLSARIVGVGDVWSRFGEALGTAISDEDGHCLSATTRLDRLLLLVEAPRSNAGRSEGFVLKIAKEVLRSHDLIPPVIPEIEVPTADDLIARELAALKLHNDSRLKRRSELAEFHRPSMSKRMALQAEAARPPSPQRFRW